MKKLLFLFMLLSVTGAFTQGTDLVPTGLYPEVQTLYHLCIYTSIPIVPLKMHSLSKKPILIRICLVSCIQRSLQLTDERPLL